MIVELFRPLVYRHGEGSSTHHAVQWRERKALSDARTGGSGSLRRDRRQPRQALASGASNSTFAACDGHISRHRRRGFEVTSATSSSQLTLPARAGEPVTPRIARSGLSAAQRSRFQLWGKSRDGRVLLDGARRSSYHHNDR
jgi:hypothetical protein